MKTTDFTDLVLESAAIDSASASLYLGGNFVGVAALSVASSLSGLLVYPSVTSDSYRGPPFVSSLRNLEAEVGGVTDRYVELGVPYSEDPYADSAVLEADVRLALELYGLRTALGSSSKYVLVDGPLLSPARSYLRPGYWLDEVALFNRERAKLISEAVSEGRIVIGFVKRVGTEVPEAQLLRDTEPSAVGPIVTSGEFRVCSYYVFVGGSGYTHTIGRVELPCSIAESMGSSKLVELLSKVYSSCSSLALPVPYSLYVADRVSKSLVKKLVELVELTAKSRGVLAVLPGEPPYG